MGNFWKHKISLGMNHNGVRLRDYEQSMEAVKHAASRVYKNAKGGAYPFLLFPFQNDDEEALLKWSHHFQKKFKNILVLGVGGSSLGAQAMTFLCQRISNLGTIYPRIHFMSNLDSESFWEMISLCSIENTGVIAISKSGRTDETLIQLMRCVEYWSTMSGKFPRENFLIITEDLSSPMGCLAKDFSIDILPHPNVGGRFSCFSLVGLLPAMIAGFNGKKFRSGGGHHCNEFFLNKNSMPLEGVALMWAYYKKGIQKHVMMPYNDALKGFSRWFSQLWAESLGKNGMGPTPISSLGPEDQHSQLQLYLDGNPDKFFTMMISLKMSREKLSPSLWSECPELKTLAHSSISDLVKAEFQATAQTLSEHGRPVRLIYLSALTEEVLGSLMMNFIIETLLFATLLQVNPLDQPAVEKGKKMVKKLLGENF